MCLHENIANLMVSLDSTYGWGCTALGDGRYMFYTGRQRADSEPITIVSTFPDDHTILLTDSGETLNRLLDAGFDRTDPEHDSIWLAALRTYRVNETDGRVFLQVPLGQAAHALNRLADAMVVLDGLRVVALPVDRRIPPSRST